MRPIGAHFPRLWRTLYELSLIRPYSRLLQLIADGTINAGMTREDAMALKTGKAQPNGVFIVSAAISQLQRRFDQLSDSEALVDLRADPRLLTPDTLKQFAQRLATLAKLWQQQ
jgi:ribosomal protein L16 Arg81 hydroxylase